MDAIFDESFTSPLDLPDLPYQGAIRLRDVTNRIVNQDVLMEYTSDPTGSCGKSVIFLHLVGFHSSRQNIYQTIQLDYSPIYIFYTHLPPQKKYYFNAIFMFILPQKST